ncbi:ninein-like protein isoform X26 [Lineus longissimus]|uniref:ninein-like protein isoform X26 n=1 Tax=Lineus longissimus TaxID=88925 RepID=UPI00315DDB36
MSDEGDFYVSQLREVFNDCDRTKTGVLNRGELKELCCRLQVEEQSEILVEQLFPESDSAARISFEEFKEGFVAVLSQAVDSLPSSENEMCVDQDDPPVSPKLVKGEKRYGRRSKPDFTGADTDNDIATDFSDNDSYHSPRQTPRLKKQFRETLPSIDSEMDNKKKESIGPSDKDKEKEKTLEEDKKNASASPKPAASPKPGALPKPAASPRLSPKSSPKPSPKPSPKVDPKIQDGKGKSGEKRSAPPPPPSPSKGTPKPPEKKKAKEELHPPKEAETFEAEGQMNKSISAMDTTMDPMSEEDHLRAIWKELGVGKGGYLTMEELAAVCEHIGMEDMNREELNQLFDNLDSDGDGHVSFDEFMNGLFQHGPAHSTTPTRAASTPPRPISSQKKPRLHTSFDGASTPAAVTAGSGLFSQIDPEGSGYARPDRVVDYWDRLGLHEGSAILRHLDFDLHSKLNLSELSFALDQELSHADPGNASYQAAVLSYQHEMKYVKSNLDHVTGERDKLKQDLHEANTRIGFLVREGDERHQNIEKTKEKEIEFASTLVEISDAYESVERRYQDQLKSLQVEAERENERHLAEMAQQRKSMENVIIGLKEEETRLKDKVIELNGDLDRLEAELLDSTERLADTERLCSKQQRELDGVAALHRKLASENKAKEEMRKIEDLESNKDLLTQEQQEFYAEKIETYQHENKELRDKNDELTIEIENLHQHLQSQKRRQAKTQKADDPSAMSHRETENSDEEIPPSIASVDGLSFREEEMLSSRLRDDIAVIKSEHEYEMAQLHHRNAHDHKSVEEKYKKEIYDIEKAHKHEKNRLLQDFRLEKDQMLDDFELQKADIESKLRRDMLDSHTRELEKHQKIFQSEKHQLELRHVEEKNKTAMKYKKEYEDELQIRLDGLKSAVNRQRETDSNEMGRQLSDIELQGRLQQEEMSLQFSREMAALRDRFNEEKARQAELHRMEIQEYEDMFEKGEEALKGKLREDFNVIIDTVKEDIRREEKIKLMDEHRREKDRLIETHEMEQARLSEHTSEAYTEEKREMEEKYRERIFKLEEKLRQHEEGLRRQLEDEYEHRVSDLKNAFKDEMMEIEEHKRMLENEIDELRHTSHLGEQYKKELDEIKNRHSKLQEDYRKVDNNLMEMMVEKEEAITAVRAEKSYAVNELSSKEKAAQNLLHDQRHMCNRLEESNHRLSKEKENLEESVADLKRKLDEYNTALEVKNIEAENMKRTNDKLIESLERTTKNADSMMKLAEQQKEENKQQKDEITAVQDQNTLLESQSNQLQRELDDLLTEVTTIKGSLDKLENEKHALEHQYLDAQKKLHLNSDEVEHIKYEVTDLREENSLLKRSKDRIETSHQDISKMVEGTDKMMRRLEDQVDELKTKNKSVETERELIEKDNKELSDRLQVASLVIQELQGDLETVMAENDYLKQHREKGGRDYGKIYKETAIELDQTKGKNEMLSEAIEKVTKNLDSKVQELGEKTSELARLKEKVDDRQKTYDDLLWQHKLRMEDIQAKVNEVDELKNMNERLHQEKEDLEKMLMETEDVINTRDKDIAVLKCNNDRLTEAVDNSSKNLEIKMSEYQHKVVELDNMKTQFEIIDKEKRDLERKNEVLRHKLEMMEEDLNDAKDKFNNEMRGRKDLDKNSRRRIDELEHSNQSLQESKDKLAGELDTAQKMLERRQSDLRDRSEEGDKIRAEKAALKAELDKQEKELTMLTHAKNDLETSIQNMKVEKKGLECTIEDLEKDCQDKKRELERLQHTNDDVNHHLEDLENKMHEAEKRLDALQYDNDKLKACNKQLEDATNDLQHEIRHKNRDIESLKLAKDKQEKEADDLRKTIADTAKQIDTLQHANDRLTIAVDSSVKNIEKEMHMSKDKGREVDRLRDENTKLLTECERLTHVSQDMHMQMHRETDRLQKQCDKLETQGNDLRKERAEIVQHVGNLENKVRELNTMIHEARKESDVLKGSKESLYRDKKDLLAAMHDLMEKANYKCHEADELKNKLDSSSHENDHLKHQLQHANDKLAELATSLSLAESEHVRDMQDARGKVANMVDMNRYNETAVRGAELERKVKDLEAALHLRSNETNKMLINAQGDFDRALMDAKEGKQDANRKLEMTRGLLHEHVEKLKIQLEHNTKSDLLVQDLYKENAQLMKALQVTEERQKQAERKVYKLEEKCAALQKLLNKIVPMAME